MFLTKSEYDYKLKKNLRSSSMSFDNFNLNTIGTWILVPNYPKRNPDYISPSGSKYWYNIDNRQIIRNSDHWGSDITSCDWFLKNFPKTHVDNWDVSEALSGIISLDDLRIKDYEPHTDFDYIIDTLKEIRNIISYFLSEGIILKTHYDNLKSWHNIYISNLEKEFFLKNEEFRYFFKLNDKDGLDSGIEKFLKKDFLFYIDKYRKELIIEKFNSEPDIIELVEI